MTLPFNNEEWIEQGVEHVRGVLTRYVEGEELMPAEEDWVNRFMMLLGPLPERIKDVLRAADPRADEE